jgi:class 3 adenylate cyclase
MGTDEEGTLAQLKAHRQAIIDPKITEYRGRIVKTTGDGLLAEFASIMDAMRCAVEVQRTMTDNNPEVTRDKRIELRIGINVGDTVSDGGDIFGDSVNLAARLESIADHGGICVSRQVVDQIEGKLDLSFRELGRQNFKNIAKPIEVYAVELDPAGDDRSVPIALGREIMSRSGLSLSLNGAPMNRLLISSAPSISIRTLPPLMAI